MVGNSSRQWVLRCGAVVLGCCIVGLLELSLRLGGFVASEDLTDPYVEFAGQRSLFEKDATAQFFQTATNRTNYFVRDRFPVVKTEGTFRIFCLGGSTVQGRPYSIETGFPKWLQLSLEARQPDRKWEVINCGGISYASYRLVPILRECLEHYEPDLIVLCTGQNEFLEGRTYSSLLNPRSIFVGAESWLGQWHLTRLMRQGIATIRKPATEIEINSVRPILSEEVDALLDYRGGLEAYERDTDWRAGVLRHFENNLRRMALLCRSQGVPLLLLSPPVNLRDTPPFKSEHRAGMTANERTKWDEIIERARGYYSSDPKQAIVWLRRALSLDNEYADTYFALGTMYELLGRRTEARRAFLVAKEQDVSPLRMLESQREILERVAQKYRVPLVDLHEFLETKSDFASLGDEWLVDHVHPSMTGHREIGSLLARVMSDEGWAGRPVVGWEERRDRAFEVQLNSLPEIYFLHGKQRLENLLLWTRSRTDGPLWEGRRSTPVSSTVE